MIHDACLVDGDPGDLDAQTESFLRFLTESEIPWIVVGHGPMEPFLEMLTSAGLSGPFPYIQVPRFDPHRLFVAARECGAPISASILIHRGLDASGVRDSGMTIVSLDASDSDLHLHSISEVHLWMQVLVRATAQTMSPSDWAFPLGMPD